MGSIEKQTIYGKNNMKFIKILCLLLPILLLIGCGGAVTPEPTTTAAVATAPVVFDIYAVNDLHGRLTATDTQPGAGALSAYVKQTENAILLATGDMWKGTAVSDLTKGQLVTEWMNETGFAAMTLGGHEYDWGADGIRENRQLAKFPFLGINVYSRETDQRVDYCQSSVTVELEGITVGIIGAIGDCYASIASEHTKNVYFQTGDALTALVKAEAEKLREQGADMIIYTLHDGWDQTTTGVMDIRDRELGAYYDISLSDGYVDLVFEADTHYSYVLKDSHGVYHLQAGGNNQGISHARVLIDKARGDVLVATAELVPASRYAGVKADLALETLLQKYGAQIAPATEVVGNNSRYRSGAMLCQLVADLYREKGVETWAERYDIVLGGGYLSCRSPGYLQAGEVRYDQLQSLFPFDNTITLCSIRGRELISKFLETENAAYYISLTDYGKSIRGQIDPDATYYLVTDSYSADYAPNRLTVIDTCESGVYARALLAAYFSESDQ